MSDQSPTRLNVSTSVVLCTYNGATYVEAQCDSILSQTVLPDEVIVGDDASTDGTAALLDAIFERFLDAGITCRLLRRVKNSGYVRNFSDALEHASGDVIFLADQDDVWHPGKIAQMLDLFRRGGGVTLAHSDATLIDSAGRSLGGSLFHALAFTERERTRIRSGSAFPVYLRRNLATGAATAFRRSLLQHALPIPDEWVHDAWLSVLAAASGHVDFIDRPLIDYRQHGGNQIGARPRTWRDRIHDLGAPAESTLILREKRLRLLHDRLLIMRASPAVLAHVQDAKDHVAAQLEMGGVSRVHRLPLVAREWRSGRYKRQDTGARSALRDLVRRG